MKIRLPSYEDAVHVEYRQEYSIDWTQGLPHKYKKVGYGTYWRIYEGDRYAFMHSGDNQPFIRKDFGGDTYGTAAIMLSRDLPVLYTRDGTKVIKKHTYPQIEQRYGKTVRHVDAPTCLVDHEFGIALPLAYNSHIYLPYRTAQPLIAGKSNTSFMVHHVTRAIQKEYKERAEYVSDRAKAMIAVLDDSTKCADMICSAKNFDPVIVQDFKAGRFDHWTMEMYLRAHAQYVNTQDALHDLSPSERHERLYLDRGPR